MINLNKTILKGMLFSRRFIFYLILVFFSGLESKKDKDYGFYLKVAKNFSLTAFSGISIYCLLKIKNFLQEYLKNNNQNNYSIISQQNENYIIPQINIESYFPPFQRSYIRMNTVFSVSENTSKKILENVRKVLFYNDNILPKFLFLKGDKLSGKKYLAGAIAGELNLPIITINPFFINELINNGVLLGDIIDYASKNGPCIVYIEDIENMPVTFTETLNTFIKDDYYYKKNFFIIIGIKNDRGFLLKNKINRNSRCMRVDIDGESDLKLKIYQLEKIAEIYKRHILFDSNLNIEKIAVLFKDYSAGQILNILKKIVQNKFYEKNENKFITENEILDILRKIEKDESYEIFRLGGHIDSFYKNTDEYIVEKPNISFENVVGHDHIKKTLEYITDYLINKDKYLNNGIRQIRGILFYGEPGCGKTLMAKALASKANATFIYINGAEFVNKYVGVGASKVREIFNLARLNKPCIIFIDEIDAIATKRNISDGGNEEKAQTLNQLLSEIDGFQNTDNILVIGATNIKLEEMDPAIIRSGRLDEKFSFSLPTIKEREKIIQLCLKNKKINKDLKVKYIGEKTSNFSGADLEYLINKAAIKCLERDGDGISFEDINSAYYEMVLGHEIKNVQFSEKSLWETAVHEIGHAICQLVEGYPGVFDSVSIIPRDKGSGTILGVSSTYTNVDLYSYSKEELKSIIVSLFGGIIAEQEILGYTTSGVGSDLKKATKIAKNMVFSFGMGNNLQYSNPKDNNNLSEIDEILNECRDICKQIILKNKELIKIIAKELIIKNNLNRSEVKAIIDNFNK